MSSIVWPHTYSDSEVLTAALLEATKTAITAQVNGSINSANIALGGVINDRLALPRARYTIDTALHDQQGNIAGTASRVGVLMSATNRDFPFQVEETSILQTVEANCVTQQGTCTAVVRDITGGADLTGASVTFSSGTTTQTSGLSLTLTAGRQYSVRVNTSGTANDGIHAGVVSLYLATLHIA